jgi:glycosyltransferase involved in cell wall biosynthesis
MKIYYFSPYDVLRPRTNQIADVRFCEGFAENDCTVELYAPYVYREDNIEINDIIECYGLKTKFKIKILSTPFSEATPKKLAFIVLLLFNLFITVRIYLENNKDLSKVIIISRNIYLLIFSIIIKKLLFFKNSPKSIHWSHELIDKKIYLWVYRNSDGIIATNSAIAHDMMKKYNLYSKKLAISLNPISTAQLENIITKKKARSLLKLNIQNPLIVYTGKLYFDQKEAEYIVNAAKNLPDYSFLITGGKPNITSYYKKYCEDKNINNILFTGYLYNYSYIINYQFAADVLLSYYTSQDHLTRYNLPQKIIEYMLTKNPIVTPDFPATRDVLNSSNAIFVAPENLESLIQGIKKAIIDKAHAIKIADQAFKDVQEFTFKKRTKNLIEFFKIL